MTIALTWLVACSFLGGEHTEYWAGTTLKHDAEGVQDGTGGRILIRADYSSPESKVIEEIWRDDGGLEIELWDIDVVGQDADTRGTTPEGSYAIVGDFVLGEPFHWTEWTWTWLWLDGDRSGQYTRVHATIVESYGARDRYLRHIEHRDAQDNLLWSREEELAEQSIDEWEGELTELSGG